MALALKDSHVLVTGANGFIGRHLISALQATGARITGFVSPVGCAFSEKISLVSIDLADRARVIEAVALTQPNYLVHLADRKNRGSTALQFRHDYDTNLRMSLNIIEACLSIKNFTKMVSLGTCDEYGLIPAPFSEAQKEMPVNAYGLSKLAITQVLTGLFHSHRFPSIVLRPSVVYGPRQGTEMFLSALIQSLVADKGFPMTVGEQYRDFVYVDDVVDAIVLTLNADEKLNGKIFNIGSGKSWRVKDVAALVAARIGQNAIEHMQFGAVPYRRNEVMDYSVDITQARLALHWHPKTSFEVGLHATVEYFQSAMHRNI